MLEIGMPSALPPNQEKGHFVQKMFGEIAHRYDLANHLLSGGLDFLWRKRSARLVQACKPSRILDLATGSGDLALTLKRACPGALVIGADFCPPMLSVARQKGLMNLVAADGLQLPFAAGTFDAVTIAFGLRNMASWSKALAEMRRILRPGGLTVILDFSIPPAPLRWVYRPYLHHVLPRIAALLTGKKAAYDYLGDSIEEFPQGAAMCRLLEEVGFVETRAAPLSGGIVSLYTGRTPFCLA
jgi:demethylmenaquinone methyltransferase/2-methoxy-6-polyprenyl-1,4-benzoquinol methylase